MAGFGERDQRSMNLALARIRRLYPRIPVRLRTVGPYQEALPAPARRKATRLGRTFAQQTLDRPADDGIRTVAR